jgi:hypothetical protein
VKATADVFTSYFLGSPETAHVISESKHLLDDSNAAKEQMDSVKKQLKSILRPGNEISPVFLAQAGWPNELPQPHVVLQEVATIMSRMRVVMHLNWANKNVNQLQRRWCCFESPKLFKERWDKLFSSFCSPQYSDSDSSASKQVYSPDPSGIPELYDSMKYDALHNRQFLEAIFSDPEQGRSSNCTSPLEGSTDGYSSDDFKEVSVDLRNLYRYVRNLFNFVAPQEYGISDKEKKTIGMLVSFPLLKNIITDLKDFRSSDKPKARLYFTKGNKYMCMHKYVYNI